MLTRLAISTVRGRGSDGDSNGGYNDPLANIDPSHRAAKQEGELFPGRTRAREPTPREEEERLVPWQYETLAPKTGEQGDICSLFVFRVSDDPFAIPIDLSNPEARWDARLRLAATAFIMMAHYAFFRPVTPWKAKKDIGTDLPKSEPFYGTKAFNRLVKALIKSFPDDKDRWALPHNLWVD